MHLEVHPFMRNLLCARHFCTTGRSRCFGDKLKDGGHIGKNSLVGLNLGGSIDKQYVHADAQQVFLPAVAFTDAALEEVSLDGALEKALGNGNHNAGGTVIGPYKVFAADTALGDAFPMPQDFCHGSDAAQTLALG